MVVLRKQAQGQGQGEPRPRQYHGLEQDVETGTCHLHDDLRGQGGILSAVSAKGVITTSKKKTLKELGAAARVTQDAIIAAHHRAE